MNQDFTDPFQIESMGDECNVERVCICELVSLKK